MNELVCILAYALFLPIALLLSLVDRLSPPCYGNHDFKDEGIQFEDPPTCSKCGMQEGFP